MIYSGHIRPVRSRREFLMRAYGGLGALAVASMAEGAAPRDALDPKKPHHPPTAKSVIWLFMEGGPSHLDLFDPKPELTRLNGQPMPPSYGKVITAMGTASNTLMASTRKFKQYGPAPSASPLGKFNCASAARDRRRRHSRLSHCRRRWKSCRPPIPFEPGDFWCRRHTGYRR